MKFNFRNEKLIALIILVCIIPFTILYVVSSTLVLILLPIVLVSSLMCLFVLFSRKNITESIIFRKLFKILVVIIVLLLIVMCLKFILEVLGFLLLAGR